MCVSICNLRRCVCRAAALPNYVAAFLHQLANENNIDELSVCVCVCIFFVVLSCGKPFACISCPIFLVVAVVLVGGRGGCFSVIRCDK